MSILKPISPEEFLNNAALILSLIKDGQKQCDIAKRLAVRESMVSNYQKVSTRWPAEAIWLIRKNPKAFSPRSLTSLANKTFSDLRGGDPRAKSGKPSLVATCHAIVEGRKPRASAGGRKDPQRLLIQERMANQELRQRLRELQEQMARDEKSEKMSQKIKSEAQSADIQYLSFLLSSRLSARVEIDAAQGKIVIHSGMGERMSSVLEKLIGP